MFHVTGTLLIYGDEGGGSGPTGIYIHIVYRSRSCMTEPVYALE